MLLLVVSVGGTPAFVRVAQWGNYLYDGHDDPYGRRKTSTEFLLHHSGGVLRGALDLRKTKYTSWEVSQLA